MSNVSNEEFYASDKDWEHLYENQTHKDFVKKELDFHRTHYNTFVSVPDIISYSGTSWKYSPENPGNADKSQEQLKRQYFDDIGQKTTYHMPKGENVTFSPSEPKNAGKTSDELFAAYCAFTSKK
jgi:hypothetical protein